MFPILSIIPAHFIFSASVFSNTEFNRTVATKLDVLTVDIQQLLQIFRRRNESQTAGRLQHPAVGDALDVMTHLEECLVSANILVAAASTIVDSRSAVRGGSEFGPRLTPQQSALIENWIPEPVILEEESEVLSQWNTQTSIPYPKDNTLTRTGSKRILLVPKEKVLVAHERQGKPATGKMSN
jgi:hypothetical protein